MTKLILSIIAVFFLSATQSQEKSPIKFGKISPEDFKSVYELDSSAEAVVIGDIGYSYYQGNERGWFTFFHNRHRRVHILNKNGFDAATVEIPLYVDGSVEEEIQSLKAFTYNVEGGKVTEVKLENKSVFKDKKDKNHITHKFTFPNVKEGSIIEFVYTIRSDFWSSPTNWLFQEGYPVLWSELEFDIPEFFYFTFMTEGYQPFYKKQPPSSQSRNFDVTIESLEPGQRMQRDRYKFDAQIYKHRWVMKDVPALKPERFTSSIMNHIAKIEFQLAEQRHPLSYRSYNQSWEMLANKLLMTEYFGSQINNANNWMDDDLKNVTRGVTDQREKARKIYQFVRDNFTCTDYSARYMSQVLKNVMKAHKGNVAEINLMLVSMLKNAGIKAEPILLSTRSHGYTYAMYPLEDKFNYVVAMAEIDGKKFYMDASRPRLGFGRLHWECYNGHARVIDKEATAVELSADSIADIKLTSLMLFQTEKGILGQLQQTPGYFESYSLRNRIKEKGKEELFKEIKKNFGAEIEITNARIDSLDSFDDQLQMNYDVELKLDNSDIIYVNPMFGEGYKENPFKSAKRFYPVEMPYTFDEVYVLRLGVPDGYEVDELPESIRVNFDEEGKSFFEYMIGNSGGVISFRSRIKMTRTFFMPEEYEILREFFNLVVSKQGEQIVFKKKK
jgi:hypothetical protein